MKITKKRGIGASIGGAVLIAGTAITFTAAPSANATLVAGYPSGSSHHCLVHRPRWSQYYNAWKNQAYLATKTRGREHSWHLMKAAEYHQ